MRSYLIALFSATTAEAEADSGSSLRQVYALVRHGNRAPNPSLTGQCPSLFPTQTVLDTMFETNAAQLTPLGQAQLYNSGVLLRHYYIDSLGGDFVPDNWEAEPTAFYFQARAQTRHQQSMAALGMGLFPDGVGPATMPARAQPMPYSSWQTSTLIDPPKACKAWNAAQQAKWTERVWPAYREAHGALLDRLGALCGAPVPDGARLKDVADGFGFAAYGGISAALGPGGANITTQLMEVSAVAFLDRLFGTPEEVTVWAADYPTHVLGGMKATVAASAPAAKAKAPARLSLFTVSREQSISVSRFFKLNLDVPEPSTPKGTVPPGDTLALELHERAGDTPVVLMLPGDGEGGKSSSVATTCADPRAQAWDSGCFFVRCFNMFPPGCDASGDCSAAAAMTGASLPASEKAWAETSHRQPYKLGDCEGYDCPLEQLDSDVRATLARTGTWKELCGADGGGGSSNGLVLPPGGAGTHITPTGFGVIGGVTAMCCLATALVVSRKMQPQPAAGAGASDSGGSGGEGLELLGAGPGGLSDLSQVSATNYRTMQSVAPLAPI
jgi:hypothetical protein